MAQYFRIVQNVDDLKRICPNLNLENVQVVSMGGEEVGLNSQPLIITQDDSLVLNDGQVPQLVYQQQPQQQQNQAQQTPTHYIIQQEEDGDSTLSQPQIFYSAADVDGDQMVQQHQMVQQQQSQVVLQHITTPNQQAQQQSQQSILVQKTDSELRQVVPAQVLVQPSNQQTTHQHVIVQQPTQQIVLQQHQNPQTVQTQTSQPQQQQQIVMRHQIPATNLGQARIIYTPPRTVVFTHQLSPQLQQHQLQQQQIQQQQSQQQQTETQTQPQQETGKPSPQIRTVQQRQTTVQSPMSNIIFTSVPQQQQTQARQISTQSQQTSQDTIQQTNQQIQQTFLTRPPQIIRTPTTNRIQVNPSPRFQLQARSNIRLNLIQTTTSQSPTSVTTPAQTPQSTPTQVTPTQVSPIQTKPVRARATSTAKSRGGRGGRAAANQTAKSSPQLPTTQTMVNRSINTSSLQTTTSLQVAPQSQSQTPQTSTQTTSSTQKIIPTSISSSAALAQHRLISQQVHQRILGLQIQRPTTSSTTGIQTGVQTHQLKFRSPTPTATKTTAANNYQGTVDLEDTIQAVIVSKNTETATTTSTTVSEPKTVDTTLTTYYAEKSDDDKKPVKVPNGRVMTLTDYKRMRQPAAVRNLAATRTPNLTIPVNRVAPMPVAAPATSKPQSSQTTQVHPQHIIHAHNRSQLQIQEGDTQKSARMLVVLSTGEQRLITFTLPKESCTVQELLEQVGVPFTAETNIQCVPNPGANIDYVVTVGIGVQENTSELISAAEQTLQLSKQQKGEAQQAQALEKSESSQTSQQQTMALAVEKTPTTADVKEVATKYIQGFYAVCQFCGYCGYDHAKCDRCRRVFHEEPKRMPYPKNTIVPKAKEEEIKRQTIQSEILNKAASKAFATIAAHRGKGAITTVRGRGKALPKVKPAEVEPVILELSSDEEGDDEKSNHSSKVMPETTAAIQKPPFPFEPVIQEDDDDQNIQNKIRENIGDVGNNTDKLFIAIVCKVIRIGTLRYESKEEVLFTPKGLRIVAPNCNNSSENVVLNIQANEIVKVIAHFPKTLTVLFIYTLPRCGVYVRESLEMKPKTINGETPYYNPTDRSEPYKRIVLLLDTMTDNFRNHFKSVIKSIFASQVLEEISLNDANELLLRSCSKDKLIKADVSGGSNTKLEAENIRQILIYPQGKGGISINTEDYMCLAIDQYLNDVIIDFYLKYLHLHDLSDEQRQNTHIFSSFFYKRLTTMSTRQRQSEKDAKMTASQKRHARVKNWTKNVNIFEKEFIVIPINEQSHWFLAIICFPKLRGPVDYETLEPVLPQTIPKKKKAHAERKISLQIGNTTITPLSKRDLESVCVGDDGESERDEAEGDESDLMSEDSDSEGGTPPNNCEEHRRIKQPCILIFDSLPGASRSRVVATLRDYLTCEYKLKVRDDSTAFTKLTMPGHCVKVPQQNNFTDCGLYLLQYVEQFFKDPIRDYHLPIKQLVNWFETIVVTRKREEISNLLRDLVEQFNPHRLPLPEISFPTINGKLVEPEDSYNDEQAEFEEEEMEEELEEEEEEDCGVETEGEGSPEKIQNGNNDRKDIRKRSLDELAKTQDSSVRKSARLDHTT